MGNVCFVFVFCLGSSLQVWGFFFECSVQVCFFFGVFCAGFSGCSLQVWGFFF